MLIDKEHTYDIPGSDNWQDVHLIQDADPYVSKLVIREHRGEKYLVRLYDWKKYDQVQNEYRLLKLLYQNRLSVPCPIEYGFCRNKQHVYLKTIWIEGKTTSQCLSTLSQVEKYLLGHQLGVSLYALHGCQSAVKSDSWHHRVQKKIQDIQCAYHDRKDHKKNTAFLLPMIQFIDRNKHIAMHQPQTVLHGNLHSEHLIVSGGKINLVNFSSWCYGDPLFDLALIITNMSRINPHFVTGLLDCYFHYFIGTRQFRLLAFYSVIESLCHYFNSLEQEEKAQQTVMIEMQHLMQTYNGLKTVIPSWYRSVPRLK